MHCLIGLQISINISTNSWGTPQAPHVIPRGLTPHPAMELEQDVGVGGCDVATPELTSKHQTNTALLPVIMPIVVSTIHTNPQNRV